MSLGSLSERLQKLVHYQRKRAKRVGKQTDRTIERNFFGRISRLGKVRRFVTVWLLLVTILIVTVAVQNKALSGYYQTTKPIPGGIFREGVIGAFTNANPIYATNNVDTAVSKLIFAGLFKYDSHNRLVGDLAKSWQVDKTGQVYTVTLRPHLVWQDGKPLTAKDVVFTYDVIKNPDAQSPYRSNWDGITVEATDAHTVVFTLPNPLSSFIYNLTNGIVPAHLLQDIPMTGLRSAPFNTDAPVGAGPFVWHDIQIAGHTPADAQESIGLLPFEKYWAGKPKLRIFSIHAFVRQEDMVDAYRQYKLNAMSGLEKMPRDMDEATLANSYNLTLTAANMVFFRTSSDVLKDAAVRRALVLGSYPEDIINQLGYPAPRVREPLLPTQFAYDAKYAQTTGDATKAAAQLDKAGWRIGKDGIRAKGKRTLSFSLVAANTREQRMVTEQLKRQWEELNVAVHVSLLDDESFQGTLINRDYDAVVYGITIGVDPDVFVYWHSSQNDIRAANQLNLAEYKSANADLALEAGRTRTGDALRKIKYRSFLKAWQADAPALGLYQPRFLYIARNPIYGLDRRMVNVAIERFDNVHNWMIRTGQVTNP